MIAVVLVAADPEVKEGGRLTRCELQYHRRLKLSTGTGIGCRKIDSDHRHGPVYFGDVAKGHHIGGG